MTTRPDLPAPTVEYRPGGPAASSLLYTLLRHGRGLTMEEAHRRSKEICCAPARPIA